MGGGLGGGLGISPFSTLHPEPTLLFSLTTPLGFFKFKIKYLKNECVNDGW